MTTICVAAAPPAIARSTKPPRFSLAMRFRHSRSTCSLTTNPAPLNAAARLQMIRILAYASGTSGMAGGQAIDLASVGHARSPPQGVENMHRRKTGALIQCSVLLGATAAGLSRRAEVRRAEALRRRYRAGVPDPGRHSRYRGRDRGDRQIGWGGHRAQQADLSEHDRIAGGARTQRRSCAMGRSPRWSPSGPVRCLAELARFVVNRSQ